MVHRIHRPGAHHIEQARGIANRAQDRYQTHRQRLAANALLQLAMNTVEIELAVLEQQQGRRPGRHYLPAQL
ncbi:hypothetical protein D3C80_2052560 [compost metagenome]